MASDATRASTSIGRINNQEHLGRWTRTTYRRSGSGGAHKFNKNTGELEPTKEQEETYFKCVKYNIQFDSVLSPYGVVDLTCIGKREEDGNGNEEKKHAEEVSLLRWWERWGGQRG
jgi:hypothetical protein